MPDRGDRLLPKSLLVLVGLVWVATLGVGEFLDFTNSKWLQNHPITSNLISSVIGFCSVTIIVGLGFTVVTRRSARRVYETQIIKAATDLVAESSWVWRKPLNLNSLRGEKILEELAGQFLDAPYPGARPLRRLCQRALVLTRRMEPYVEACLVRGENRADADVLEKVEESLHEILRILSGDTSGLDDTNDKSDVLRADIKDVLSSTILYASTILQTFKLVPTTLPPGLRKKIPEFQRRSAGTAVRGVKKNVGSPNISRRCWQVLPGGKRCSLTTRPGEYLCTTHRDGRCV
jgi:hypothetical protein